MQNCLGSRVNMCPALPRTAWIRVFYSSIIIKSIPFHLQNYPNSNNKTHDHLSYSLWTCVSPKSPQHHLSPMTVNFLTFEHLGIHSNSGGQSWKHSESTKLSSPCCPQWRGMAKHPGSHLHMTLHLGITGVTENFKALGPAFFGSEPPQGPEADSVEAQVIHAAGG